MADDPLAGLGTALAEDHKAAKRRGGASALAAGREHLGGDTAAAADATEAAEAVEGDEPVTALDRAFEVAQNWEIDFDALVPDVRDFLLEQIKRRPKPWSEMLEAEKRDIAGHAEQVSKELVRRVVEGLAVAGARQSVRMLLTKVNLADKTVITGELKAAGDEETNAILHLHQWRGKNVMITIASADDHMGGRRDAAIEPDQQDMGFEAGDDSDLADDDENDD